MDILITSIVDLRKSAHNRLHQFIKHLSKKNHIDIICINDYWKERQTDVTCYGKEFDKILSNVNIIHLTDKKISPYWQELFSATVINKALKEWSYDVHFNYNTLISGLMMANKLKKRDTNTVYDIADNLPGMIRTSPQVPSIIRPLGGVVGNVALRKNIQIASKVTVVTKFLEDICSVPKGKSEILPNGVDTQLFKNYLSTEKKSKLGIDNNFVIGYVGVLREWVNLEPVFAAVNHINKDDIKILIVGEEGRFNETKNLVEKYDIKDKVIFTGTVPYEEVPKYISCTDVCLIPFFKNKVTEDPCPLKLFEYMACEKPVISTVYINAVQDRILYASTVEDYKNRLSELYKKEEVREQFGKNGRSFVKQFYDWSDISLNLEKLLESEAS